MQMEIIHNGRITRQIFHNGKTYLVAPESGDYKIRLYNPSPSRQMAVISVDGVNVVNGEDAGFSGPGYVIDAWGTVEIPGWRRDGGKAAAFEFKAQEGSYAAQTGRGTSNVGVIGVAVFAEKVKVRTPSIYRDPLANRNPLASYLGDVPRNGDITYSQLKSHTKSCGMDADYEDPLTQTLSCMNMDSHPSASMKGESVIRGASANFMAVETSVKDVGTGYGHEVNFHTHTTDFQKASSTPSQILQVQYATLERLQSWGVPTDEPVVATSPNPFPMSQPTVPAPNGWHPNMGR